MSLYTLTKQTRLPVRDLSGQVFGRWTVLRFAGRNSYEQAVWHCRCACGKRQALPQSNLTTGVSRSCGCYRDDVNRARAGERRAAEKAKRDGYQNGTAPFDAGKPVDQQSLRARLKLLAKKLRPDADPITSSLRPSHSKTDALARACALLALRYPTEDQLWDCRFALEIAGLETAAGQV